MKMNKDESTQNTSFVFWEDKLKQNALASYDPRIFFIRVVSHGIDTHELSDADVDSINEQIAAISHILVRRKVRDFSSQHEIINTLANAFCLCSIGLEYSSMGDLLKATQLLLKNKIVKFFRIGNTLVNKLHRKATAVKQKSILFLPKRDFFSAPDELELYSSLEKQFIEALLDENRIMIDHADMEIEVTVPAQPIDSLADITIAEKMLDNLALRTEYIHYLFTDGIDAEAMLDAEYNPIRKITQALIVNLALNQQVVEVSATSLHVESEDLVNFQKVCCDSATGKINNAIRDFLLKWVETYFENRMLEFGEHDESVKRYAIEYWKYCIEKLCET